MMSSAAIKSGGDRWERTVAARKGRQGWKHSHASNHYDFTDHKGRPVELKVILKKNARFTIRAGQTEYLLSRGGYYMFLWPEGGVRRLAYVWARDMKGYSEKSSIAIGQVVERAYYLGVW